ncbi:MAG: hypothetical protein M1508_12430 [Nitrospirae bacterium]|nr:hypothetical protein [Nitrospirota bacterium]
MGEVVEDLVAEVKAEISEAEKTASAPVAPEGEPSA